MLIGARRAFVAVLAVLLPLAGCASPPAQRATARSLSSAGSGSGTAGCAFTAAPAPTSIPDLGRPPAAARNTGTARMTMTTNQGVIEVAMEVKGSPCAVASFAFLAGKQYFDKTSCHRLTQGALSVLQCGDPTGTGTGGPGYQYAEEQVPSGSGQAQYRRGVVAVARTAEPGTSGSQFFICYRDAALPPDYTVLGTVTAGMEVVDKVAAGGLTPAQPDYPDDGTPKIQLVLQKVTVAYS